VEAQRVEEQGELRRGQAAARGPAVPAREVPGQRSAARFFGLGRRWAFL
jgi:hypothetical protein